VQDRLHRSYRDTTSRALIAAAAPSPGPLRRDLCSVPVRRGRSN